MENEHKFKKGDLIYIKVHSPYTEEFGKIVEWNEEKQMYVLIHFLDNVDPEEFWRWCYVKEEDIDLMSNIDDELEEAYKRFFKDPVELYEEDFDELYTEEYYLQEKYCKGLISIEEYFKESHRIEEANKMQYKLMRKKYEMKKLLRRLKKKWNVS